MEDQIESGESELKKLKTEEHSLRRLTSVKKDRLATAQFRMNKKHEDAEQYKRTVLEYGLLFYLLCWETGKPEQFPQGSKPSRTREVCTSRRSWLLEPRLT